MVSFIFRRKTGKNLLKAGKESEFEKFVAISQIIKYNLGMADEIFSMVKKDLTKNKSVVKKLDWLIFTINEKLYALPSARVKEILKDSQVFPVPFVPSYINGILNRYGDPYAVADPAVLFDEKPQKTSLFIVINDDSHTCLRITDVKEFFSSNESDIRHFTDDDISEYFEGTLKYKDEEVFVLKVDVILERMVKDFESK